MEFENDCFINRFVFGDFIEEIICFGVACCLIDILQWLSGDGKAIFDSLSVRELPSIALLV